MFTARPLRRDETNPIQAGMNDAVARQIQMALARQQDVTAQYAPQMAQQNLLKEQLANMFQAPRSQMAGQFARAELKGAETDPAFKNAQIQQILAGIPLTQLQTQLLRNIMPAKEAEANLDLIKDPLLRRLAELQQAQKMGSINPQMLQQAGLGGFGGPQQGMPLPGQQQQTQGNQGYAIQPNQYQALSQALGGNAQYNPQQAQQQPQMRPGINAPQAQPGTAPKAFTGDALQNWAMFGTPLSPYQEQEIKAYGKGLEKKEETNVTNWNEKQKELSEVADTSIDTLKDLDQFTSAYEKLSWRESGAVGGRGPALSSTAQKADNAAAKLVASVVRAWQQGRITDKDLNIGQLMKVSRSMNTEAVKTIADSLRTALNRKKEQQPFMNELKKEGISLQTANELWQNYNEQYPTYDYKSDKALTENLNKWQNFFKGEKSTAQPTNAGRDLSHMSDEQLRAIAGGR